MKNEVDQKSKILTREQSIFGEYPVPKAVAVMVIPTIIGQIISVIYNLADTWYVGMTGDAAAVAAISLCLPVYNIMTALGNLFGIGGSSVIARALGTGQQKRAQAAFSLAVRGAFVAAACYALAVMPKILIMPYGILSSQWSLVVFLPFCQEYLLIWSEVLANPKLPASVSL